MQEECTNEKNREVQCPDTSQRKFINALLNPLKQHPAVDIPSGQLILKERKSVGPLKTDFTKNLDQERTIKILQRGLHENQETIASLLVTVEEKQAAEDEMAKRFNNISKMCETFTKYYNNLCDNFKNIESDRDTLSQMYNNIIAVQQSKLQELNENVTREQMTVAEQKMLVAEIENKSLAQETRINQLLEYVNELKEKCSQEKKATENAFAAEKYQLLQDYEKLKLEKDKLYEALKNVEVEKANALESLGRIDKLQEELSAYRAQTEQLSFRNAQYASINDTLLREKQELQEQLNNLTVLQEVKVSALKEENGKLVNDVAIWKKQFKEAENVYEQLEEKLNDMNNKYSELKQRYAELEKSAEINENSNYSTIRELRKKVEFLQKDQEETYSKKNMEIVHLKEVLEEKYKQECSALSNEITWNRTKLCEMEKMASEREQHLTETKSKLLQTEKENNSLREKIHKLETDNKTLQSIVNDNSHKATLQINATQLLHTKPDKHVEELKKDSVLEESSQNRKTQLTDTNKDKMDGVTNITKNLRLPATTSKASTPTTTDKKIEKKMDDKSLSSKSGQMLQQNIYDFVLSSDDSDFDKCLPEGHKMISHQHPTNQTYDISQSQFATRTSSQSQFHFESVGKNQSQSTVTSLPVLNKKKQTTESKKEKCFFKAGKTDEKDSNKRVRKRKW